MMNGGRDKGDKGRKEAGKGHKLQEGRAAEMRAREENEIWQRGR